MQSFKNFCLSKTVILNLLLSIKKKRKKKHFIEKGAQRAIEKTMLNFQQGG